MRKDITVEKIMRGGEKMKIIKWLRVMKRVFKN